MSDVLVDRAARIRCAREHGRRHVYTAAYGGRLRDCGQPCDRCRLVVAAELAASSVEPMR